MKQKRTNLGRSRRVGDARQTKVKIDRYNTEAIRVMTSPPSWLTEATEEATKDSLLMFNFTPEMKGSEMLVVVRAKVERVDGSAYDDPFSSSLGCSVLMSEIKDNAKAKSIVDASSEVGLLSAKKDGKWRHEVIMGTWYFLTITDAFSWLCVKTMGEEWYAQRRSEGMLIESAKNS